MPKNLQVFRRLLPNRPSRSQAPPTQTVISGPSDGPSGDVPDMLADVPKPPRTAVDVSRLGYGVVASLILSSNVFLGTFVPHSAIRTVGDWWSRWNARRRT